MKTCISGIVLSIMFVGCLAGATMGDYNNPPPGWSNNPYFTHQQWEFSTAANPSSAEPGYVNPNGVATAEITGDVLWINDPSPYVPTTRRGVWATGSTTVPTTSTLVLDIPNTPALPEKLVWLQLTYFTAGQPGGGYTTELTTDGGENVTVIPGSETAIPIPGEPGWFYYEIMWSIIPQPGGETITASLSLPAGAVLGLDEGAVDTICIPEPATIGLLLIGATTLLGSRKR